jgi:hypothetical protein
MQLFKLDGKQKKSKRAASKIYVIYVNITLENVDDDEDGIACVYDIG